MVLEHRKKWLIFSEAALNNVRTKDLGRSRKYASPHWLLI